MRIRDRATRPHSSRSAALALVIGAAGLLYVPVAQALPLYTYAYTGKPFNAGVSDPNDPRYGGRISIEITTPTPLNAGGNQLGIDGLSFTMNDGTFDLFYPREQPPYDMTYPISYWWLMSVYSLSSDGLPTSWDIQAGTTQGTHGAFNEVFTSTYYAPGYPVDPLTANTPWDNSYLSPLGPMYIVNDPGTWSLTIAEVPEPTSLLLLAIGMFAWAAAMRSGKRRRARATVAAQELTRTR